MEGICAFDLVLSSTNVQHIFQRGLYEPVEVQGFVFGLLAWAKGVAVVTMGVI